MALVGEMHYLTIGDKTYSIAALSTETDPVFSASAAAGITATDISNWNAKTSNVGTVTSVRVQATSPVQSSTSTQQTASLNTTISLANGYGDTKNPYGTKTANYVLAGPTSGSAAVPTFRALIAADIPDLSDTYLTSYTETDPTVPAWAKASTKPSYTAAEVGALPDTTAIPSKTSDLTNDSGFITSADVPEGASAYTGTISAVGTSASTGSNNGFARGDHIHNITKTTVDSVLGTGSGTTKFYREDGSWATPAYTTNIDVNVTNTAVTAATTYYLTGSTNSSTETGELSKHAAIKAYVTANSGTGGSARIDLGNTTATTSSGGKEGILRLYGTSATYYIDVKAGAPSANRTITFPNNTGTVALTSDIPTVPTRGTATSGGTTLSLVNTGDMYTWNNKSQVQIVRW